MTPIIEVAKENIDLNTATLSQKALTSEVLIPKIYAVQKTTPSSGVATFSHGLTYPPASIMYQEFSAEDPNFPSVNTFSPSRYAVTNYSQVPDPYTDSSSIINNYAGTEDSYAVLFLDPLENPSTDPAQTILNGNRIVVSNSIEDADYKRRFDSKYHTFQVVKQGTLTCSLPQNVRKNTDGWRVDEFTVAHGLTFPPVFSPMDIDGTEGLNLNIVYTDEATDFPTTITINNLNNTQAENWLTNVGITYQGNEICKVYVDETNLILRYKRLTFSATNYTFPARTIYLKYIIFSLPITEEFNLLT